MLLISKTYFLFQLLQMSRCASLITCQEEGLAELIKLNEL